MSGFFSALFIANKLKIEINISRIESIALEIIAIEFVKIPIISFTIAKKKAVVLDIIVAFLCRVIFIFYKINFLKGRHFINFCKIIKFFL